MKTPGLISRLAEVMAPESKEARGAAAGIEDAGFSAVSIGSLPIALNMSAGMAAQLNGSMSEISRADLGNVSKGIPQEAPMPERNVGRDAGISM